jgi:hypothetical protein
MKCSLAADLRLLARRTGGMDSGACRTETALPPSPTRSFTPEAHHESHLAVLLDVPGVSLAPTAPQFA